MAALTARQCDVINALAFASINIAEAARVIGCARNTMLWHIAKIRKNTELDPLDFFDLQELYEMAGGDGDADEKASMST